MLGMQQLQLVHLSLLLAQRSTLLLQPREGLFERLELLVRGPQLPFLLLDLCLRSLQLSLQLCNLQEQRKNALYHRCQAKVVAGSLQKLAMAWTCLDEQQHMCDMH